MKRMWKTLPSFVRWLLVTIFVMMIVGGAVYAYVALTGTGQVTVEECLSWVGPNTFDVTLYPQESQVESLTLANASTTAITIDVVSTVTPDPGPKGLTIDVPNNVTIPGSGQEPFDITITAGKSAESRTYAVSIEIVR